MTLDDLELLSFHFQRISWVFVFADFGCNNSKTNEDRPVLSVTCKHAALEKPAFASRGFVSNSWAFLLTLCKANHSISKQVLQLILCYHTIHSPIDRF